MSDDPFRADEPEAVDPDDDERRRQEIEAALRHAAGLRRGYALRAQWLTARKLGY